MEISAMPSQTCDPTEAIREIQRKVRLMLEERQATCPEGATSRPSRYWTDFCSYFDYMIDLAPHSFEKLRLHTYHLTGDNYQTYYFAKRQSFLDYWGPWLATDGLPQEHVLSEPDGGIGFRLDDGRFVSQDVARFQKSVATLSRRGILDGLARLGPRPRIIEIGGGYGGLALHLSRILPRCRYVIVDLPETLIFSAAYLALHAPGKRIYLYDPAEGVSVADLAEADFVLLPDYRIDALLGSEFDLAINVASMQEMRIDQVEHYLDFLRDACRGVFYSCNRDRQNRNDELPGLFDLVRTRFAMTEVSPPPTRPSSARARARQGLKRSWGRAAPARGLAESDGLAVDPYPFVEHLCQALPTTG